MTNVTMVRGKPRQKKLFQYTGAGLKNIYLANGYDVRKTKRGTFTSVQDVEGLHRCIGEYLVKRKPFLTGPEFRFLRKGLGMSQKRLGELLGHNAQSVARTEKLARVPKWLDHSIRWLYAEYALGGNADFQEMIDKVNELDRLNSKDKVSFGKDDDNNWTSQVA